MASEPTEPLFCYGTLQQGQVQLAELGRVLAGTTDRLEGYRLVRLPIADPIETKSNGAPCYPAIVPDSSDGGSIDGTLYWLTADELARADKYEAEDYERRRVALNSGQDAWVYVAAQEHSMEV